jgi:1-acyl-sn-glycerol-3-phosphate acyltransferase
VQIERGEQLDPGSDRAAEALLVAVRDLMADVGRGHAAASVSLDAGLDTDLGLDSVSVAELLVRTEEQFGVSLPVETLATARTPRDLLAAVAMASAGPPADVRKAAAGATAPGLHGPDGTRQAPPGPAPGNDPRRGPLAPSGPVPVRSGGWARRATDVLYGVWALGVFSVLAVVGWLLIVVLPSVRLRWRVVRWTGRVLARLTGVRVTIDGAHHLPHERPFVLVANHPSHLDALVLTQLLEEPAVVTAVADLAEHPVLALGLRRMHAHLVARGDRVRAVADAEALTDTVRAGRSAVFFPEGHRSSAPGLEPFRMGAFLVAARSGAPVVPVAIRGTRAILPVGRLLPRRATVTVTVAPPLTTQEAGWQGAVEMQREARGLLLRHTGEPDLA